MEKEKHYAFSLLSKLNTFQKDTLFCDGIIKVAGKQFSIHKVIFSAASPYFRTLFCNGMVETFSSEVELQGISSECFSLLLDYIYTGTITVSSSNVEQLVEAGRLFQLDDLVEYCCEFLISELTVENCLGILSFAQLHSCTGLFTTVLTYVHLHFDDVCKTEEFLQLDWSILLSFLKSDSIKISSEDGVFIAVLKWTAYDTKNRCGYIKQLLTHVKLPLVSPRIAETHCALCEDTESTIYEAYSACLQEQQCSKNSTCPRTYSKRYFYIIGGLMQRQDGTSLDPVSLPNVERCEVPSGDAKSFQFLQTNNVRPMNQPRNNLAITSLNGLIYAIGGENESFIYDSVECYNPIIDQWIIRAPMLSPRVSHGACVIDGEIYVIGGWIGEEIAKTMEKYNPGEDTWVVAGNIPTPRFDAGVCEVNGLIYIIGGVDMHGDILQTADCYDPVRERWSSISPMLHKRMCALVSYNDNYIYAIGGESLSDALAKDSVERYDVQKNQWEEVAPLPFARLDVCATCINNYIYVFGGRKYTRSLGYEYLNTIECYDTIQNEWSTIGQLNSKLSNAAVVVV